MHSAENNWHEEQTPKQGEEDCREWLQGVGVCMLSLSSRA